MFHVFKFSVVTRYEQERYPKFSFLELKRRKEIENQEASGQEPSWQNGGGKCPFQTSGFASKAAQKSTRFLSKSLSSPVVILNDCQTSPQATFVIRKLDDGSTTGFRVCACLSSRCVFLSPLVCGEVAKILF